MLLCELDKIIQLNCFNSYFRSALNTPTSDPHLDSNNSPIICKRPAGLVSTYTNREQLQTQIRDALCKPQCPNVEFSFSLVNLHGIGGNGKSQLAKKVFALSENCDELNGNLIWLDAGTKDILYDQFASLVSTKGYSAKTVSDLARLLYVEILKGQKFLIIFDNVVDFTMITEYLPVNAMNTNARVLLTSKKHWDIGEKGTIYNVPVGVFHPVEARTYVCQFTNSVTEEQLVEICRTTSRIPADLSLICHSYRYSKEELSESYSWAEHLKHYGNILSTQEAPKDHLPGVEGVDYTLSTRGNVELSMNLLESVSKLNAGPFAVFILKNFAFCYGQQISRNEFAHRIPAFRLRSDSLQLTGSVEIKINYGLNLLRRFGFIEALDGQDDDVMFHIHQSYQCALLILIMEGQRKRSKFYRKPKDERKSILIGLIEWAQLQEPVHDAFVSQKFLHMTSFWVYINKYPELVAATTKTRDFLMFTCLIRDYDGIKTIKKYARRNFVAMLLDNKNEDKSNYYYCALQTTIFNSDLSILFELVLIVTAELNRIQKWKRSSSFSLKRIFRSITSKNPKSIQLTEEYIHRQMLHIAYMSVTLPAFELIYSNFPLEFSWPLEAENNRTLLQGFVMMTDKFEADAAVIPQLEVIINLNERYNTNLHNSVKENFLNNQDVIGNTALHYAVMKGSSAIVNVLLESSASAGIKNYNGLTALDFAIFQPDYMIEEMMSERFDLLDLETDRDLDDIIKKCRLKKAYPSADILEDNSYSQQMFIEYEELTNTLLLNYGTIVELILSKGKGIGIDQIQNALGMAFIPKTLIKLGTIASLLSAGADANYEPPEYFRPLHAALQHIPPSLEIIKLLLDHGANPLLTDIVGQKPIDWLEKWRHSDDFIMDAEQHYQEMKKLLIDKEEEMKR